MMKPSAIDRVVILYNPKSTGDGKTNAERLIAQLHKVSPKLETELKKTEYAGYGEELARQYSLQNPLTLLISSSGDGGYHELINGVLVGNTKNVITSLLPSGNANDHHRAVDTGLLTEHIVANKVQHIDVLKISATVDDKPWSRYGHSYVGIGLTPVVGKELTKKKLNFFNEKWLVLKYLFDFTHVSVLIDGKKVRYSSLIFSNIAQMSKVVHLSKESSITDGKFEISALRYQSKFSLLAYLFRAVTIGLEENASVTKFEFRTLKKLLIQIDGEDFTLDAGSAVKIQSAHNALRIIA